MALSDLLRTKSLEQLQGSVDVEGKTLQRKLGALDLTMFGIGAIIGAGIFSTIGTAAAGTAGRPGAGPALILSFVLTAIGCGFTALCYAELASMIPVSGSAYTYAYATLGEAMAWVIGWDLVLEYAVSNVAVAISWGDYARSFLHNLGIDVPAWLAVDPRTALTVADGFLQDGAQPAWSHKLDLLTQALAGQLDGKAIFPAWEALKVAPRIGAQPITFNLLAVVITLAVTWLCYRGIRESAQANTAMVIAKMLVLLAVVGVGAHYVKPENWTPFAPNGFAGIQAGAAIIFFAFIGFDAVSTTAEECRNPARDMPLGILGSLVICTVVYVAITAVVTGMVGYQELGSVGDPLSYVFEKYELRGLATVVSFGAVIATAASLLVYQVGQPRILMAMSRDGLLGEWFGRVHPKFGTPSTATVLTGFVVALPAALMNIGEVVDLANIGTLFAFAVVCIAVPVLRMKRPEAQRRFRVPAVWFCAPAGVLSCAALTYGLPAVTWIRFFLWLVVGLAIYAAYGFRKSRLATSQS